MRVRCLVLTLFFATLVPHRQGHVGVRSLWRSTGCLLLVQGSWEFGNSNDPSSSRLWALWSQRCSESDFNLISLFYLSCLWSVKYIFREREGSFPFRWTNPKPHLTSRESKAHSRTAEPAGVTFKVQIQILVHLLILAFALARRQRMAKSPGVSSLHPPIPPIFWRTLLATLVCMHHSTAPAPLQYSWELWNCVFPVSGGKMPSLLSSSPVTWTEGPWILDRNGGSVFQEVSQALLE